MKTYTFYEQSYWLNACCDCCSDEYIELYNSKDTDPILGSCHSVEDCFANAILSFIGPMDTIWEERYQLYQAELYELKSLCRGLGIEVVINYENAFN